MEINALKNGDVVLFSPEKGSFLSEAICLLTDSNVSHAAMVYNVTDNENSSIIEESPPKVAINNAKRRFTNRIIYVRRLQGNLDMSPVIKQSELFLNEEIPYNDPELYMLGLLLVYKKFSISDPLQEIIIKILKKLSLELVDIIDKIKYDGKKAMICSEFVDKCYNNSGNSYKLIIKNGVLSTSKTDNFIENKNLVDISLDYLKNNVVLGSSILSNEEEKSFEKLAEEFCEEFRKNGEPTGTIKTELLQSVQKFALLHHRIRNGFDTEENHALKSLKSDESMFVFPCDLLNHCENLEEVGVIELKAL